MKSQFPNYSVTEEAKEVGRRWAVIDPALKMGVAPRAEITRPDQAQKYLEWGVKHFCIGTDVSILFDWFKDNGGAMRELLGERAAAESGGTATSYRG